MQVMVSQHQTKSNLIADGKQGVIRPNITFVMGEASETVKASTWNGPAIYFDQFDVRFEQ